MRAKLDMRVRRAGRADPPKRQDKGKGFGRPCGGQGARLGGRRDGEYNEYG